MEQYVYNSFVLLAMTYKSVIYLTITAQKMVGTKLYLSNAHHIVAPTHMTKQENKKWWVNTNEKNVKKVSTI